MTDERTDERHRGAPAWAGTPTSPWSRVPGQRPPSDAPDPPPAARQRAGAAAAGPRSRSRPASTRTAPSSTASRTPARARRPAVPARQRPAPAAAGQLGPERAAWRASRPDAAAARPAVPPERPASRARSTAAPASRTRSRAPARRVSTARPSRAATRSRAPARRVSARRSRAGLRPLRQRPPQYGQPQPGQGQPPQGQPYGHPQGSRSTASRRAAPVSRSRARSTASPAAPSRATPACPARASARASRPAAARAAGPPAGAGQQAPAPAGARPAGAAAGPAGRAAAPTTATPGQQAARPPASPRRRPAHGQPRRRPPPRLPPRRPVTRRRPPRARRGRHASADTGMMAAITDDTPAPAAPAAPAAAPVAAEPAASAPRSPRPRSAAPVSANPVSPAAPPTPVVATPGHGAAGRRERGRRGHRAVRARRCCTRWSVRASCGRGHAPATTTATVTERRGGSRRGRRRAGAGGHAEAGPDPEQVLAGVRVALPPRDPARAGRQPGRAARDPRPADREARRPPPTTPSRARLLSLRAVVVADPRRPGQGARRRQDGAGARRGDRRAAPHRDGPGPAGPRAAVARRVRRGRPALRRGQLQRAARPAARHHARARRASAAFDQGRYMEACNHFEKALELRKVEDPELVARTEVALDARLARVAENGLGPVPAQPRTRSCRSASRRCPTFDERVQCWGFADADGRTVDRARVRRRAAVPRRRGLGAPAGDRDLGADRRGRPAAHRPARRLPRRRLASPTAWPGCPRDGGGRLDRHRQGQPGGHLRPASTTSARSGAAWRRCAGGGWGAVDKQRPARGAVRSSTASPPRWPTAATSTASPTRAWPSWSWAAARAWWTAPAACSCRRCTRRW